jgi:YesN/AraC family two-component response regulator
MKLQALIVDDSPVVRQIIRFHLTSYDCQIVGEAGHARGALDLFHKHKPNLITLDLMMPTVDKMSAEELFETVKRESPKTEIVVISAVPFDRIRNKFQVRGALDYIVKPINQFSFQSARHRLARAFPEL